ncbi:hypothetical protein GMSM_16280 [Geomonas sp. Red276]
MKKWGIIPMAVLLLGLTVRGASAFSCGVTTTPVGFGSYDVFSGSPLDGQGAVALNCNNPDRKPILVTVAISSGQGGSFNPRQMIRSGGSERLNYYLFLDPAKTTIWGDGTGGSSVITQTVSRSLSLNAGIYGRIPERQDAWVGSYSDTLTVTVSW